MNCLKSVEKAKELKEAIEERVKEVLPGYKEYFRDIRGMTLLRFGILMGEIKDIKRFSKEGKNLRVMQVKRHANISQV